MTEAKIIFERKSTATKLVYADFQALFSPFGGTDEDYLRVHFRRFVQTRDLVLHTTITPGQRLLDIGAHWLHQSLIYAQAGFAVTALDLPDMLGKPEVQALAQSYSIELLPNADLEHPQALRALPENSIDVVLFTEIIEHLTFNPVMMWREIHRVLKPEGRIVVTTPNYYALRSTTRRLVRALRHDGAGVSVHDILTEPTRAHHWKEYSLRELIAYFHALSPDFSCTRHAYLTHAHPNAFVGWTRKLAGTTEYAFPFARPALYFEVNLIGKSCGLLS